MQLRELIKIMEDLQLLLSLDYFATEERIREAGPRADGLYQDDHQAPSPGRKILASSFTGGPRWYNSKFQV